MALSGTLPAQLFAKPALQRYQRTRRCGPCQADSGYRWSAEREGGGRRLRESVFDNAEPASQQAEEAGEGGAWEEAQQEEPRARDPSSRGEAGGNGSKRRSRRERGSSRGDGAAGGDGRPPPPEAWSEWGPSEETPPDAEEWGWAADSWVPDSGYGGARAGPNRRRGGSSRRESDGEDAFGRSGGYPDAELEEGDDLEDDEEGYDEDYEEERSSGGGFAPPRRATASDNRRSSGDEPSAGGAGGAEPDIALLSPAELDSVLPVIPFPQQAAFYNGSATDAVQRWAASLALTVLISKVALLAATSLTWPLWWPWAQAAAKNYNVRKAFRYAGLWRTQVLEVSLGGRPRASFGGGGGGGSGAGWGLGSTMRTSRFLLGDPGGAQTEVTLPYDARFELVREGEPVEVVVLSGEPTFESFKAVKDAYLPSSGVWLTEYPFADRNAFLEVSLAVEQEAQAAAAGPAPGTGWQQQAQQQQQGPGQGYGGGPY